MRQTARHELQFCTPFVDGLENPDVFNYGTVPTARFGPEPETTTDILLELSHCADATFSGRLANWRELVKALAQRTLPLRFCALSALSVANASSAVECSEIVVASRPRSLPHGGTRRYRILA